MILAICIFICAIVFHHNNCGKIYEKHKDGSFTFYLWNTLFVPSAIYVIWFVLNYFNIV